MSGSSIAMLVPERLLERSPALESHSLKACIRILYVIHLEKAKRDTVYMAALCWVPPNAAVHSLHDIRSGTTGLHANGVQRLFNLHRDKQSHRKTSMTEWTKQGCLQQHAWQEIARVAAHPAFAACSCVDPA